MCGIFACLAPGTNRPYTLSSLQEARLHRRGPDHLGHCTTTLETKSGPLSITCHASVLSLRGTTVIPQPVELQTDCSHPGLQPSALCWNGEIWRYKDQYLPTETADTAFLADALAEAIQKDYQAPTALDSCAVIKVLHSITGPFAFVLVDTLNERIFFGRDSSGRRSLLTKKTNDALFIASVGDDKADWIEVDAVAIHCIYFSSSERAADGQTSLANDSTLVSGIDLTPETVPYTYHPFNMSIPANPGPLTIDAPEVSKLHSLLHEALVPRVTTSHYTSLLPPISNASSKSETPLSVSDLPVAQHPRIAILFSGGLDCTTLATLTHAILPLNEPIDLLNVAFENPRLVRSQTRPQQKGTKPPRSKSKGNASAGTLNPDQDTTSHSATKPDPNLDSMPPPTFPTPIQSSDPYALCPDRQTALSSLLELRSVCPSRKWRLVKINVPYTEFCEHRGEIQSLMAPSRTEMDLSIAAALYFAGWGVGEVDKDGDGDDANVSASRDQDEPPATKQPTTTTTTTKYTTPARVLISGLGADELLAGYQRHATAFNSTSHVWALAPSSSEAQLQLDTQSQVQSQSGPTETTTTSRFTSLLSHLQTDYARLPTRNLSRDDRILSHHAKEPRFPFLDERVVRYLISLPVNRKCGLGIPDGDQSVEAGKRLLRLLALRLGLQSVAREKKRAIQFGARSAKMESGRSRGTDSLD